MPIALFQHEIFNIAHFSRKTYGTAILAFQRMLAISSISRISIHLLNYHVECTDKKSVYFNTTDIIYHYIFLENMVGEELLFMP